MMSFASETKNELSRILPEKQCCMLAEQAGFIRTCGSIALRGSGRFRIVMNTEHPAVARHIHTLMKACFRISPEIEVGRGSRLKKGRYYLLTVEPEQLSEQILRDTGIVMMRNGMNYITDGIYDGLVRKKCDRKAFLRGAFLGAGTMTHPEKAYRYEIVCNSEMLASDLRRLINTFEGLHARTAVRRHDHVVYVRDAEQILDLLALMGAHSQYFFYEEVRLRKEMRNEANRRSNCDQANIDKSVAAAERQLASIRKIRDSIGLDALPPKLEETARARLEHPDVSIEELGKMMDPPLKKSGINHRLRKLAEIAQQ